MPHTQQCRDEVATLVQQGTLSDEGWCIGGCTLTADDYPDLAQFIAARAAFATLGGFVLPDARERSTDEWIAAEVEAGRACGLHERPLPCIECA